MLDADYLLLLACGEKGFILKIINVYYILIMKSIEYAWFDYQMYRIKSLVLNDMIHTLSYCWTYNLVYLIILYLKDVLNASVIRNFTQNIISRFAISVSLYVVCVVQYYGMCHIYIVYSMYRPVCINKGLSFHSGKFWYQLWGQKRLCDWDRPIHWTGNGPFQHGE